MLYIKIKKRLLESEDGSGKLGLVVYIDRTYHHLMFVNMKNFQNYVDANKPQDPDEKIDTLPFLSSNKEFRIMERNRPIVVGYICLEDTPGNGKCFNALQVILSANHEDYTGKGFGKEFYKIAMAYADSLSRPIRPDIAGPKPAAQHVWQSLERDSTVLKNFDKSGHPTAEPADVEDEFLEDGELNDPSVMSHFDFETPKKTKPEIDDCEPNDKSSVKNFLNRAYTSKSKIGKFEELLNNAEVFIDNYFEDAEDVYDKLAQMSHSLFSRRYSF